MTVFFVLLALTSAILAKGPSWLITQNLRLYRPPGWPEPDAPVPSVSVLIPARDEEQTIEASVSAALASQRVNVEVIVLDDRSEDDTARIVEKMAHCDPRIRLVHGDQLPPGWCGKQYACWRLAHEARHDLLVFLDADVRLSPDALARLTSELDRSGAALLSGFPRQETVGLLEKLVIPLIHFILLGFLPIRRMRRSLDPAFAAGCGQLFITHRADYERSGGHDAIRTTLHDGLKLPRAYRLAGLATELCDVTDLAVCRMYRSPGAVWSGLSKNAGEAMASPRLIVPLTFMLLVGQVLPVFLVIGRFSGYPPIGTTIVAFCGIMALLESLYSRWRITIRFRQSRLGALLHPVGILILLAIQWSAFLRNLSGRPSSWKGRQYLAPASSLEPSRCESSPT